MTTYRVFRDGAIHNLRDHLQTAIRAFYQKYDVLPGTEVWLREGE